MSFFHLKSVHTKMYYSGIGCRYFMCATCNLTFTDMSYLPICTPYIVNTHTSFAQNTMPERASVFIVNIDSTSLHGYSLHVFRREVIDVSRQIENKSIHRDISFRRVCIWRDSGHLARHSHVFYAIFARVANISMHEMNCDSLMIQYTETAEWHLIHEKFVNGYLANFWKHWNSKNDSLRFLFSSWNLHLIT